MSRFGIDAGIASTPNHRPTVRLDRGLLQFVDQAPCCAPEPLRVQRRVSCRGALVVAKQRIHVGIVHAGRTLTIYGNRLVNSNEYCGAANGEFVPDDHGTVIMGALESSYFSCYGTSNCRF
jgi:hypothetical protein